MAGEAKLSTGPCTKSLPQGSRRASSDKPLNSPLGLCNLIPTQWVKNPREVI